MKKRFICILLAGIMSIALSACSDSQAEDVALITGMTVEEVKSAYELAEAYLNTGDYLKAMNAYEIIPGYKDSGKKQEKALTLYQEEIATRAREYLDAEQNYSGALALVQQARLTVGDCALFREVTDEIEAACLNAYLALAEEALNMEDFDSAEMWLQTLSQIVDVADPRITEMDVAIQKGRVISTWKSYQNAGDVTNGLLYLQVMLMGEYSDPDVIELYNLEYAAYKKQILEQAESQFLSSGYEAGIIALQAGTQVLSEDPDFQAKMTEYLSYRPISLAELDYYTYENDHYNNYDTGTDNLGNEHQDVFRVNERKQQSQTYRLHGNYERMTGVFYLMFKERSSKDLCTLQIYGDNILLFDSGSVTAGVDPVTFDISLAGVDQLVISTNWSCNQGSLFINTSFEFGDVLLYRAMPQNVESEFTESADG